MSHISENTKKQVPEIKQFEKATSFRNKENRQESESNYSSVGELNNGALSSRRDVKSPIQLKDKLQNLYNEYINVKNKTYNINYSSNTGNSNQNKV